MTHEEGGFVDFFNDVWLKIMAEQEGVMVALLSAIAFGILVSLKLTYEERSQQRQQHQPTASEETTTNQPGVEVDGDGEESEELSDTDDNSIEADDKRLDESHYICHSAERTSSPAYDQEMFDGLSLTQLLHTKLLYEDVIAASSGIAPYDERRSLTKRMGILQRTIKQNSTPGQLSELEE